MSLKVAIVTPYTTEPQSVIERCVESVRNQTRPATHFLIADGHPQEWIDGEDDLRHLKLDKSHESHPLAAMAIGSALAAGEQYDAIGLVTVDSTLAPNYVEACVETAEREYQLHFVLVDSHPNDQVDAIGSLFVLRRGFPSLPGLALLPSPLADMGFGLILEKFRILEYHGVATEEALVKRTVSNAPPMDAIRSWWAGLPEERKALVQKHIGGKIEFAE